MPAGEAKMCDENTNRDSKSFVSGLTRRDFSKFTVSAAAALSFGNAYSAKDIETVDVYIETPDGVCDALFAYPVTGCTLQSLSGLTSFPCAPHFVK